jgi:hypothetical protein
MAHVKTQQRLGTLLTTLLVSLLALPATLAASTYSGHTGISPLNKVVETLAWMFNTPILQNRTVQVGFIRFCLFILFLAVAHWSFKKIFKSKDDKGGNKTAGIVSTVFALIAAFLMPEAWVTANGGVITAVFTALIPLGIVGLGIWFALAKMNKNFATRLMAIVILFLLLAILDVYRTSLGLPLILLIPASFFRRGDC